MSTVVRRRLLGLSVLCLALVACTLATSPNAGGRNKARVATVVTIGTPGCAPGASFKPGLGGLPQAGVDSSQGSLWALFFDSVPPPAGKEIKIVWRMTGTGPFAFDVSDSQGSLAPLAWGPEPHGGSNWEHPGDEVGTGIAFPHAGCWRIQVSRSRAQGELWLSVVNALP